MKKVKSITCTIILLLLVSATAAAKEGSIPTTKSGTIPTTRLGTIPTTRTNLTFSSESIQTARSRTTPNATGFFLMELFWTLIGWQMTVRLMSEIGQHEVLSIAKQLKLKCCTSINTSFYYQATSMPERIAMNLRFTSENYPNVGLQSITILRGFIFPAEQVKRAQEFLGHQVWIKARDFSMRVRNPVCCVSARRFLK